ncbi:MAG: hypothetical protein NTW85_07965 [Methylococcales bacterium]|nr:hypothetical protein [Methylococcales bacterium]
MDILSPPLCGNHVNGLCVLLVLVRLNHQLLQTTTSKIIAFGIATLIIVLSVLLWLKDIAAFLTRGFGQWVRDFHKIKRLKLRVGQSISFSSAS